MKLKYNFVTNEVANKIVAVAVGDDLSRFNGFIKMNDTGAFIFERLRKDTTEDAIVADMMAAYADVTEDEVRETVHDFIQTLKNSGVLE